MAARLDRIVLNELDLLVDCTKQMLHPRDPDGIVSEIESLRHPCPSTTGLAPHLQYSVPFI